MNDILEEDFIPVSAIIVYSQGGNYNEHYLESRQIVNNQMQEGVPLTKKLLAGMLESIDPKKLEEVKCTGFLPRNLLAYNNDNAQATVIWYLKESERNLVFSERLNIKEGLMKLPMIVFKLVGNSLSVFAVKANHITQNTVLYHAPFFNVYDNGSICMGNAKIEKSNDVQELMENAENAFFQSKFTELHGQAPINGNLATFTKKQIKSKKKFDKSVLKVFGGQPKYPIRIKDLFKI
jgi:PRTRC genetic system protein B